MRTAQALSGVWRVGDVFRHQQQQWQGQAETAQEGLGGIRGDRLGNGSQE